MNPHRDREERGMSRWDNDALDAEREEARAAKAEALVTGRVHEWPKQELRNELSWRDHE